MAAGSRRTAWGPGPRRGLWRGTRAAALGAALALARVRALAQLAPVGEAVAVGVPLARVRVEAADLGAVAKPVSIRVRAARMGPQAQLSPVARGGRRPDRVWPRVRTSRGGASSPSGRAADRDRDREGRLRSPSRRDTRTRPSAEPAISTSDVSSSIGRVAGAHARSRRQCHPFTDIDVDRLSEPGRQQPHTSPVGRVTFGGEDYTPGCGGRNLVSHLLLREPCAASA